MWLLQSLSLVLLVASTLAQEEEGPAIRKIRLRRPPRPLSVSNVDGIAKGRPVPLRSQEQSTADLLAATLEDNQGGNDALQSLLATAAKDELIEEEPVLRQEQQPVPTAPRRRRPGVPRRRPRPQPGEGPVSDPQPRREEESGNGRPKTDPVKTTERYSHMNDDGSFTFGYVAEDGSFREETRGVDCITRGKYGYIDPEGKRREFTYVSGLPCDQGDEDLEGLDENEIVREDPIAPADRFRTSAAVQLQEDEIPIAARPRIRARPVQARPPPDSTRRPNFPTPVEEKPQRQPARRVRPRPTRPTSASSPALQNLFNVVDGVEEEAAPQPTQPRARPTPTTPRPAVDFDREVDSFTLGRPAITFDDENRSQQGAPGPNFSTELVFDPTSGTFKTELRQSIPGGEDLTVTNDAAPSGRRPIPTTPAPTPTPTQRPTPAAFSPTPRPTAARPVPFTAFASTTRRPTPASPSPAAFTPLSFPTPTTPAPSTPSPAPTTPSPSPSPTTPATPPTPRPTPVAASPATFFFQPFPTAGARPVAPGQPATPQPVTQTIIPSGTFTLGQPVRPVQPQASRPAQPQASPAPLQPQAVPGFPRPTPVVQVATPTRPATPPPTQAPRAPAPTPQIQFGFNPVVQQPQQPSRPFTAFASGLPPQLSGQRQAAPQRPAQFQTFQPQQFQSRPPPPSRSQQLGVPPQLQQQPSRFSPFSRPQPQASRPFTVFNPTSFSG